MSFRSLASPFKIPENQFSGAEERLYAWFFSPIFTADQSLDDGLHCFDYGLFDAA